MTQARAVARRAAIAACRGRLAASLAPDLATSSVVLSVGEDGTPAFAVNMAAAGDTGEVESRTLATFTDLRVGLFLVNQGVAHTLSKVTTFTTGEEHHL